MFFHTDRCQILITWQKPWGRKKVISDYRKGSVHMSQENFLPALTSQPLPIIDVEYDSSSLVTIVIKMGRQNNPTKPEVVAHKGKS